MIAINSWKGFRPFVMLSLTSQELSEQSGIEFRPSFDDLDAVRESAFSGKSGTVYGLVEHVHSPVPGVEILAHESDLSDGALFPTFDALSGLGIARDKVRWSLAPQERQLEVRRRCVFVSGHDLHRFEPEFVQAIRNTIRTSGFDAVGIWEDVGHDARLREHTQLLAQSAIVLYLTATLDKWSYYELGLARGLRKPVWALILEKWSGHESESAPQFDREVRVPDPSNIGSLRQALRDALTAFDNVESK